MADAFGGFCDWLKQDSVAVLDAIDGAPDKEEHRQYLRDVCGLQDSFEAAATVSLAMLPAAATKPGVGWRHVTEAGLCQKWNLLSIAQCWRSWDVVEVCHLEPQNTTGIIKGHHRVALLHALVFWLRAQDQDMPDWLMRMARAIPVKWHGKQNLEAMVAEGYGKTAALEEGVLAANYIDLVMAMQDGHIDEDSLRKRLEKDYAEYAQKILQWRAAKPLVKRVPRAVWAQIKRFMQVHAMTKAPIPFNWFSADNRFLMVGERKRSDDFIPNEEVFTLMVGRWLAFMQKHANDKGLCLTKNLSVIQNALGLEQRLQFRALALKYHAGISAATKTHRLDFKDLESQMYEGEYDTIVGNSLCPATTGPTWTFVRKKVAESKASLAQAKVQEADAIVAEAQAAADKLDEETGEARERALQTLWAASLQSYSARLLEKLPPIIAEVEETIGKHMEDEQKVLLKSRNKYMRLVHDAESLCKALDGRCGLFVLDSRCDSLSGEDLKQVLQCVGDTGCALIIFNGLQGGEMDRAIAHALTHGATQYRLLFCSGSLKSVCSAALLCPAGGSESAASASGLMKEVMKSGPLSNGVTTLKKMDVGKDFYVELLKCFVNDTHSSCILGLATNGQVPPLAAAAQQCKWPIVLLWKGQTAAGRAALENKLCSLEDELVSEGQDPKVKEQKQKDLDSKAKQCPTMPKCPQELEDIRKIGMKKVVFMREMQLDASGIAPMKPVPLQSDAVASWTDPLQRLKEEMKHGLLVAPSAALPGEFGVYASKAFKAGEVIYEPVLHWQLDTALSRGEAALSEKSYCLKESLVDNLGRATRYCSIGSCERDLWCCLNSSVPYPCYSTATGRQNVTNVKVERCNDKLGFYFVAAIDIQPFQELFWNYEVKMPVAEQTPQKRKAQESSTTPPKTLAVPQAKKPMAEHEKDSDSSEKKRPELAPAEGETKKKKKPKTQSEAAALEKEEDSVTQRIMDLVGQAFSSDDEPIANAYGDVEADAKTKKENEGKKEDEEKKEGEGKKAGEWHKKNLPRGAVVIRECKDADLYGVNIGNDDESKEPYAFLIAHDKKKKRFGSNEVVLESRQNSEIKQCSDEEYEANFAYNPQLRMKVFFEGALVSLSEVLKKNECITEIYGCHYNAKNGKIRPKKNEEGKEMQLAFIPAKVDAAFHVLSWCRNIAIAFNMSCNDKGVLKPTGVVAVSVKCLPIGCKLD